MPTSQMLFSKSKAVGGPQANRDGEGTEGKGGGQGPLDGAWFPLGTAGALEARGMVKVSSLVSCCLLCLPSPGVCSSSLIQEGVILCFSAPMDLVPGTEEISIGTS